MIYEILVNLFNSANINDEEYKSYLNNNFSKILCLKFKELDYIYLLITHGGLVVINKEQSDACLFWSITNAYKYYRKKNNILDISLQGDVMLFHELFNIIKKTDFDLLIVLCDTISPFYASIIMQIIYIIKDVIQGVADIVKHDLSIKSSDYYVPKDELTILNKKIEILNEKIKKMEESLNDLH